MFGIGGPELILILAIALVVIGPKHLPDLAKALGRGIGEFRKATNELKNTIDQDGELSELSKSLSDARNEVYGIIKSETSSFTDVKEEVESAVDELKVETADSIDSIASLNKSSVKNYDYMDDDSLKAELLSEARSDLGALDPEPEPDLKQEPVSDTEKEAPDEPEKS